MAFHRQAVVMCRPADLPIPHATARLPVTVGLLQDDEVDEYNAFYPWTGRSEALRRLRSGGHECFTARYEGRLVSADWASTVSTYARSLHCVFPLLEGDVYTYEMYTLPEFRRRGIATAIKVSILRHYCQAGCNRFLNLISPNNLASIKNNERLGYRQVGLVEYWGWAPLRRHYWHWDGGCGEQQEQF